MILIFLLGAAAGAGATWAFVDEGVALGRHDHAAFKIFVDGQPLVFTDLAFNHHVTNFSAAHIHTEEPDPGVAIHMEARKSVPLGNATLGDFLASLGMELSVGHVKLGSAHGGVSFTDNASYTLKAYARPYGGVFTLVADPAGYHIQPCDRILLSWGSRTDVIDAEFAAVPTPPGGTTYPTCL